MRGTSSRKGGGRGADHRYHFALAVENKHRLSEFHHQAKRVFRVSGARISGKRDTTLVLEWKCLYVTDAQV